MRESRLFKMIYYILEKGQATAPELAEQFEVSVRTIYRDVDAISAAGIPVYVTTGRNGGIRIMDNYVLDKAVFSDQEKKDILGGLQSLAVVDHTMEKEMLTKLSALFQMQSEGWFEVDFGRWGSGQQDNEKFEQIKQAVITHHALSISYVGTSAKKTKRVIHPLKLYYKSKEWYVKAFCTKKQDYRMFKLNRIVKYELLEEEFTPTSFPRDEKEDESQSQKIVLSFRREMAYRLYDEFSESEIAEQTNGDFLVTTNYPISPWLVGYLLSFGTGVKVVKPESLRKVVANEAKKISKQYKP